MPLLATKNNDPVCIVCMGEAMLELRPDGVGTYAMGVAGDVLNTAAGISALGGKSAFLSASGTDDNSLKLIERCETLGVDTTYIEKIDSANIGLYLITNDAHGERFFSYWRDRSAAHQHFYEAHRLQQSIDALARPRFIYLSGITLSRTSPASQAVLWKWLAQCRSDGAAIVYDGNYRPSLWDTVEQALEVHRQVIGLCTIFLPGLEDEMALRPDTGEQEVIAELESLYVPEMIIKNGAQGLKVYVEGQCTELAIDRVSDVIDTSGAGDSFNAGYLACRMRNVSPIKAARFAATVSAMVIRSSGAIPPLEAWLPLRKTLESFDNN